MSKWKKLLQTASSNAESKFDELKFKMKTRLKLLDKIQIVIYNCYASENCIYIRGRVLEDKKIKESTDQDSVWDNLLRTYKRLETDEIPDALLEIEFNGIIKQVRSDEEGYFYLPFELDSPIAYQLPRLQFTIRLLDFPVGAEVDAQGTIAEVYLPPAQADFGVISDVDDTIMRTDATSLLKMAKATFLQNAHTRVAFRGVAKFYEALRVGKSLQNDNPFFYVSSSPWNLFDLIRDFIHINQIPMGAIQLRDYGIDETKFLVSTHGQHKRTEIETILKTYPHLNFILIGDSGQEDTFIYHNIAKDFPDRILAIYIRDAKVPDQMGRINATIAQAHAEGIEMLLVPDSLIAAQHAARMGYINGNSLPDIEKQMDRELKVDTELGDLLD